MTPGDRARYDAWWLAAVGPCVTCKSGSSTDAVAIRGQGESFRPMRNFGPDRDLPVRYLLVGMEPSEGWSQRPKRQDRDPDESRNFGGLSHDGILQFAAREWLCRSDETFLATDMAKCPTRASIAGATQGYRWTNCAEHLEREAALFKLRAVVTVGTGVYAKLKRRPWAAGLPLFNVLHYSPLAASHRSGLLVSEEDRNLGNLPVDRFTDFLDERRAALRAIKAQYRGVAGDDSVTTGDGPRRGVSRGTKMLLAVYRKQFGAIRRAVEDVA